MDKVWEPTWEKGKPENKNGIFIYCKQVGISPEGIDIPTHQIPIIKKAIIEWEMKQ